MGLLDGRVALVTGAGRGIGREEALLLAKHGAAVVVNDLGGGFDGSGKDVGPAQQVVDEIKKAGGKAVANGESVSDFKGAKRMVDAAVDSFGSLDIVVNNAGILRDRMIFNMSEEDWDAVLAVHLKGTFAVTRHAAEYWRNKNKQIGGSVNGRVINTSSDSGLLGNPSQSNYGAAKAAIAAFSVIIDHELKKYGVTVNAIAPVARTRLTVDATPATAALTVASLQVGGTVGTLALIGWIRRRQFQAVAVLFLIAVPVVGSIGYIGLNGSEPMLLLASFIAGACVLGVQSGINVCGALVYPTSLRALGSGWELGIGRLGSIVGPLVGALFVRMPVDRLYMWSAAPFLLGAIICYIVHRLNQERIRHRPWLAQVEGAR